MLINTCDSVEGKNNETLWGVCVLMWETATSGMWPRQVCLPACAPAWHDYISRGLTRTLGNLSSDSSCSWICLPWRAGVLIHSPPPLSENASCWKTQTTHKKGGGGESPFFLISPQLQGLSYCEGLKCSFVISVKSFKTVFVSRLMKTIVNMYINIVHCILIPLDLLIIN